MSNVVLGKLSIEALEDYMGYSPHSEYRFYGTERFCIDTFKKEIRMFLVDKMVECTYSSDRKKISDYIEKFFIFPNDPYYSFQLLNKGRKSTRWGEQYFFDGSICGWFEKNAMEILDIYLKEINQTFEKYIYSSRTFYNFWNGFSDWFEERRRKFMNNMIEEIQKKTGVSNPKTPKAHGGVANLLKLLTNTMKEQGSDIRSIAKVQYAVCTQAGIFIPNEFLTDVAVALDVQVEN